MSTDPVDLAVSRRLAKLRNLPMDLSALTKAIETQIPRPLAKPSRHLTWLGPMRAVAASILVVGLVFAIVIASSAGPVLASPITLARVHQDMISGSSHTTHVDSIDAANDAIAASWSGAPRIPSVDGENVIGCCVHTVGRKKIGCVAMKVDGVIVTMAVADAADVKMPTCEARNIGGGDYHVQSHEGTNMVMTQRNGRWVCLMGNVAINRLVGVVAKLKF